MRIYRWRDSRVPEEDINADIGLYTRNKNELALSTRNRVNNGVSSDADSSDVSMNEDDSKEDRENDSKDDSENEESGSDIGPRGIFR